MTVVSFSFFFCYFLVSWWIVSSFWSVVAFLSRSFSAVNRSWRYCCAKSETQHDRSVVKDFRAVREEHKRIVGSFIVIWLV